MTVKNGIFREKFPRFVSYGTRTFSTSGFKGGDNNMWYLCKLANGNIYYLEMITVVGQDKGWRTTTKCLFDPDSLEWKKLK